MLRNLLGLPLLALTTALSPALADDPLQLPEIGDPASQVVSPQKEQELGEAFYRRLRQTVQFVDDPEIVNYLRSLGNRLAAHSSEPGRDFTFFIVRENSINAFAAPGGYIGAHSGLILAAQRESELAAVMAHEIAHVTQRHLARAYDSASRMNLPTAAAILASILIATQNSEAGQAALMSVQAGSIQQQINFTRGNEKEADRIGMQTLRDADFDPAGMPDFFDRLQQQSRYYGSPPPFLSTHPVTSARIADAMARIDQMGRSTVEESLNFYLIRAKLRAATLEPGAALAYFSDIDSDRLPPPARDYGLAQAYILAGQADKAIPLLRTLHETDPDRIAYRIALAQAHSREGRTRRALDTYQAAIALYPGNPVISHYYAEALVQAGEHRPAYDLLTRQLRQHPEAADPELYQLLAKAASGLDRPAEAYEAMGEYYYRNGQTHAAIEQYELALQQKPQDFYSSSRLEARLARLKREALAEREQK
ncbi:MAG TPA: M48 family metalloprotease [Thiohalobacter sp.]|nr:M48 family metalloprotease [Thiohalobacter sp.]